MGLGPCGGARGVPRRRAALMNTAMLFGCLFFGGWALRGSPSASTGPPRLWQRPSARRRVACGGVVCGGGTTGTRRCRVVDIYEERRRSHRRHALRIAMAELQDMSAAKTDEPLVVKVKPPTPTLDKIKERLRREKSERTSPCARRS